MKKIRASTPFSSRRINVSRFHDIQGLARRHAPQRDEKSNGLAEKRKRKIQLRGIHKPHKHVRKSVVAHTALRISEFVASSIDILSTARKQKHGGVHSTDDKRDENNAARDQNLPLQLLRGMPCLT